MEMIGGNLALDFANTVGWHAAERPIEHLETYTEFAAWARHAGVISATEVKALTSRAARSPGDAARALRWARALRETIYRVFTAAAGGKHPASEDLGALQKAAALAMSSASVGWRGGLPRVRLSWPQDASLEWPGYPVALAAGALLLSPSLERLGQCGNHPCGWLFIDTSRNGSRRWCTSAECGNATRVRRFRARDR